MHGSQPPAGSEAFRWPKEPFLSRRGLQWRTARRARGLAFLEGKQFRCFWGRNGIYHSLAYLGISPEDRILVPAYLCSAAIEPILAYGARVDFYRVTADCQPDFDDLESRIQARTRGVFLVHYFGFPSVSGIFREICNRHDLVLIEDCAHVLTPGLRSPLLGTIGDASVFSWRKFLPVYDGCTLVIHKARQDHKIPWCRQSALFDLKVAVNLMDQMARSGRHSMLRFFSERLRHARGLLKRRMRGELDNRRALAADMNMLEFVPDMANEPMSRISRWILDHSNLSWIKSKRQRNYNRLAQACAEASGMVPLRPILPTDVCPWVFPLFLDHAQNAQRLLRRHGIPAVSWSGVRHPAIARGDYPGADYLYENLLFLPVHQNLDETDMVEMAQTAQEVVREAHSRRVST